MQHFVKIANTIGVCGKNEEYKAHTDFRFNILPKVKGHTHGYLLKVFQLHTVQKSQVLKGQSLKVCKSYNYVVYLHFMLMLILESSVKLHCIILSHNYTYFLLQRKLLHY